MEFNLDETNKLKTLCIEIRNVAANCCILADGIEKSVDEGMSGTECQQALKHISDYLEEKADKLCQLCEVPGLF